MRWRCLLVLFVAIVSFAGCNSKVNLPPLHPVEGMVTYLALPVTGGSLILSPDPENPAYVVTAKIDGDSKFKVTTMSNQDPDAKQHPGAPEGTYKIKYLPSNAKEHPPETDVIQQYKVNSGANDWKVELKYKK